MDQILLTTKPYFPPARPSLVSRPRLVALFQRNLPTDVRQLPHAPQRIPQEVSCFTRVILCDAPISIQVGICSVFQHLRQPGSQVERVVGTLSSHGLLQSAYQSIVRDTDKQMDVLTSWIIYNLLIWVVAALMIQPIVMLSFALPPIFCSLHYIWHAIFIYVKTR